MTINPGITNLISWWSMDETSGNAIDLHGSNNLTETSGSIVATTGKVNGGRDIEAGDTEYFEIADNASLSFGDENFTGGIWIKPESLPTTGLAGYYMSKWNYTDSKREYVVGFNYDLDSNSLLFMISADGTTTIRTTSAVACSAGNWYFVVFWHDSINNLIGISVNDETPVTTSHSTGCLNSDSPFRIGANGNPTAGNFADGVVDEAFLYRRLLTADERAWLYNSGNGRNYTEVVPKDKLSPIWIM